MKPRGTGHIVNIASLAGKAGAPGLATYCATKHGVVGLSEAVRAELRGTGVEVTVVMPGFVNTELIAGVQDLAASSARRPRTSPTRPSSRAQGPALRRLRAAAPGRAHRARRALLPRRAARGRRARDERRRRRSSADRAPARAYEARAAHSAPAAEASSPRPRPTSRRRRPPERQPVGDRRADQRPLVLLQEVAGARDQAGRRPPERGRERLARPRAAARGSSAPHSISVGRRSLAQRREHAPPGVRARRVGRLRDQAPGTPARRPCAPRSGTARRRRRRPRRPGRCGSRGARACRPAASSVRSTKARERVPGVAHRLLAGEQAGVHQHEPRDALGVLDREPQADRAAPVVHDERRVAQVEVLEQRRRRPRRGGRRSTSRGPSACPSGRSPARSGRITRWPASQHAAAATLRHRKLQVGSPCNITTGRAVALVDVREAQPVDGAVARRPREVRAGPSSSTSGVRMASVIRRVATPVEQRRAAPSRRARR